MKTQTFFTAVFGLLMASPSFAGPVVAHKGRDMKITIEARAPTPDTVAELADAIKAFMVPRQAGEVDAVKPKPKPAPKPTQPAPAPKPKPTEPAPAPKPTEPAPAPKPTEPAPAPKPTEPAPEPKPTEPVTKPEPTKPESGAAKPTKPAKGGDNNISPDFGGITLPGPPSPSGSVGPFPTGLPGNETTPINTMAASTTPPAPAKAKRTATLHFRA